MSNERGKALVVGAGISGIRSALDLAETGYKVCLIDKSPYMGGILSKLDYQFPTDRCGMCRMLPLTNRDSSSQFCLRRGLFHENIELMLSTSLAKLEGEPGNYTLLLKQKRGYINPDLCIGCGECAEVCDVEIPDFFNEGLKKQKAVYLPVPHAVPNIYTIDPNYCNLCGECVKKCPANAITLPDSKNENSDEIEIKNSDDVEIENSDEIEIKNSDDVEIENNDGREFEKNNESREKKRDEREIEIQAGVVILACGTDYFNPEDGINTFGYKKLPNVVTNIEFERIISGTGLYLDKLARPSDGKEVEKIAWIQCVGSRNIQTDSEYCSSVCCMFALKEAVLAKKKSKTDIKTVIYYMDLRCFGKEFHAYRKMAEEEYNVILKRAMPHSVTINPATGNLRLFISDDSSETIEEEFDMVVLSVGQRPSAATEELAIATGIELNSFGFPEVSYLLDAEKQAAAEKQGVFIAGSFSGLKDISESVIYSSAASCSASSVLYKSNKSRNRENYTTPLESMAVLMENPKIAIALCSCPNQENSDIQAVVQQIGRDDPHVSDIFVEDKLCTEKGWDDFLETIKEKKDKNFNRLIILACLPSLFQQKLKDISVNNQISPCFMEVVDIYNEDAEQYRSKIKMGIARLRHATLPLENIKNVVQKVLIVGGGFAGMKAALAVAENGFEAVIVEQSAVAGGNLKWLSKNIKGDNFKILLNKTIEKIEKNPFITLYSETEIDSSQGEPGRFITTLKKSDDELEVIEHGAVIIATGGTAAKTESFSYNDSSSIITQKELEQALTEKSLEPEKLKSVVMIQCVDSRDDKKEYCSRICCTASLKHALFLKSKNHNTDIYILYRDMMSYGFLEKYFKQAREKGIIFIQYSLDNRPEVNVDNDKIIVKTYDKIINHDLEIEADLLVLATGIVPNVPEKLVKSFGAKLDKYSFFEQADSKFRPVDSLKEGVFSCGIALGPRDVEESAASALAAAGRALRLITRKKFTASSVTAEVKTSLCTLCERCIDACPYSARRVDYDLMQIVVNPAMCQGCGACASECVNSAAFVNGFKEQQVFEMIDAAVM
ncbi:MAG: FAD-dependent oxidoreductase [Thermodesulfobacteriota bacterium]|nr:FAD-dependent oxidoreductase [Thermodesulfobacteriota bacterium]